MWLARSADRVFAQTPSERQALIAGGVRAERVVVQGLGVDPVDCTGGLRQAWAAPDEVVVGHLSNNSEEKGTVDLLRAAELLWQRGRRSFEAHEATLKEYLL